MANKGSGQRQLVRLDAAIDGQPGEERKSLSRQRCQTNLLSSMSLKALTTTQIAAKTMTALIAMITVCSALALWFEVD